MKKSICVFGLAPAFTKNVAKRISAQLEMNFACVEDLIEFDLINTSDVKKLCGAEYLKKLEGKKVREVTSYQNTLIHLKFPLLNDKRNFQQLKENCVMVYISLSRESFINKVRREKITKLERILSTGVFDDRHKILKNSADIVLDCTNTLPVPAATRAKNAIIAYYKEKL